MNLLWKKLLIWKNNPCNTNINLIKLENNSINILLTVKEKISIKLYANAFFSSIPKTNFFKCLSPLPTNVIKKASSSFVLQRTHNS